MSVCGLLGGYKPSTKLQLIYFKIRFALENLWSRQNHIENTNCYLFLDQCLLQWIIRSVLQCVFWWNFHLMKNTGMRWTSSVRPNVFLWLPLRSFLKTLTLLVYSTGYMPFFTTTLNRSSVHLCQLLPSKWWMQFKLTRPFPSGWIIMSVTPFSGMNCEFWNSIITMEKLAVLEVLELQWRLLSRVGGFLLVFWYFSFCPELVPV